MYDKVIYMIEMSNSMICIEFDVRIDVVVNSCKEEKNLMLTNVLHVSPELFNVTHD